MRGIDGNTVGVVRYFIENEKVTTGPEQKPGEKTRRRTNNWKKTKGEDKGPI